MADTLIGKPVKVHYDWSEVGQSENNFAGNMETIF